LRRQHEGGIEGLRGVPDDAAFAREQEIARGQQRLRQAVEEFALLEAAT
jgi:hypothetical protein